MCNCKPDQQVGTFRNVVTIPKIDMPSHMQNYLETKDAISIDRCILWEVLRLWNYGITTTWSCCGHNTENGMIGVIDEDVPKMFILGYQRKFNPFRAAGCVQADFYAKSVERVKED